jgi:hypothetical protein
MHRTDPLGSTERRRSLQPGATAHGERHVVDRTVILPGTRVFRRSGIKQRISHVLIVAKVHAGRKTTLVQVLAAPPYAGPGVAR